MAEATLLERLRARTSPTRQAGRGPVYNHPPIWYARPDGDVVLLQGDPQNRAYYEDKGYAVLRPDEVREWLEAVRPQVVAEQRRKASLITTIRAVVARNPMVHVIDDLDAATIDDLEAILGQVGGATTPMTVIQHRGRAAVDDDEPAGAPGEMGAGDQLAEKLARSAERAGKGR